MNKYLSLSNFIKENLSNDWMTSSQRRAYDKLIDALSYHNYINLYGAVGTGKTFLGWLLHKNQIGHYFPHWLDLEPAAELVIVDNASERREDFRNLIKEVQLAGIQKLVVISRKPINDYVASVELDCQQIDLAKMADNLDLSQAKLESLKITNLWELFRVVMVRE